MTDTEQSKASATAVRCLQADPDCPECGGHGWVPDAAESADRCYCTTVRWLVDKQVVRRLRDHGCPDPEWAAKALRAWGLLSDSTPSTEHEHEPEDPPCAVPGCDGA